MNQLNLAQVEQLKEIGAHLRQLRQEQSISTEEVAAKTFIPSRLLKALEEGESDQLPEPIFIQGFIRRYANALDQDGDALAKTFPTSLLPVKSSAYDQEASRIRSSTLLPYVAYILLLITAASGLVYLLKKPQTAKPPLQGKNLSIAQQQTLVKSPPSSPTPPKVPQATSPIQVTVSLKEESWLRVVADGKTQFEGTLTKGKQQTWKAKKQLTIRAGNAGAVLTSFNQKEPKP